MNKTLSKGQEAVEFALLSAIILGIVIAVILLFGKNISSFFTNDSSIVKQSQKTSDTIKSTDKPRYNSI